MNKHPANRAERLRINEKKNQNKETRADKVRRKLAEELKERETEDELRQFFTDHRDNDLT